MEGLTGGSSSSNSSISAAGPKEVATAMELVAAVAAGATDIRVTDHMDLTGLPGYGVLDPGVIPTWKLRSIRVRHTLQYSAQPFPQTISLP